MVFLISIGIYVYGDKLELPSSFQRHLFVAAANHMSVMWVSIGIFIAKDSFKYCMNYDLRNWKSNATISLCGIVTTTLAIRDSHPSLNLILTLLCNLFLTWSAGQQWSIREAQEGKGPQLQQAWAQWRPSSAQLQHATSGHGFPHTPFLSKHWRILKPE